MKYLGEKLHVPVREEEKEKVENDDDINNEEQEVKGGEMIKMNKHVHRVRTVRSTRKKRRGK